MNTEMITKWLGKRRMAKVGKIWSEGNGVMVILKEGLTNDKWDTNGIFISHEETLADQKAELIQFFDDIVEENN
jgi:hypothetical protein